MMQSGPILQFSHHLFICLLYWLYSRFYLVASGKLAAPALHFPRFMSHDQVERHSLNSLGTSLGTMSNQPSYGPNLKPNKSPRLERQNVLSYMIISSTGEWWQLHQNSILEEWKGEFKQREWERYWYHTGGSECCMAERLQSPVHDFTCFLKRQPAKFLQRLKTQIYLE